MSSIIQSHIHLSTSLGSAPENAPTLKWKVRDRREIPKAYIEISDTLQGFVYDHVVGGDTPVTRLDYQYDIKIIGDNSHDVIYYKNLLQAMHGRRAFLVDNLHSVDGTDHTPYVQQVMVRVGEIPVAMIGLLFFYVPVSLESLENPS